MFLLKKIISALLLPPMMPLVLIVWGVLLRGKRAALGKGLIWLGVVLSVTLSSGWSVSLLLRPLEDVPVLTSARAAGAEAIVILGGGTRRDGREYGGETVSRLTLERLRYGARLYRDYGLPLLVAGGAPQRGRTEGDLMKESLEQDFQVPVRWVENGSWDTRENAENTAALLRPLGIKRVILVTHAAHMRRSVKEFQDVGFDVAPAPTAFMGGPPGMEHTWGLSTLLPTETAAYGGWYGVYEWLGLLARKIRVV